MVLKCYMCSKNILYASDIYVIFIGHGDLSYISTLKKSHEARSLYLENSFVLSRMIEKVPT